MKKNLPVYVLAAVAVVLLFVHLSRINFDDLSWAANESPYFGVLIVFAILVIVVIRLKNPPKQ